MSKLREWSEIAKNITQILAIVVAGCWTYQMFIKTEAPSLEPRVKASGNLSQEELDKGNCFVRFHVTVENTGKTSFAITEVQLRGWFVERRPMEKGSSEFFDIEDIAQKASPFFQRSFHGGPFIQRYAPGNAFNHTYEWTVRKAKMMVLMRAEFRAKNPEGENQWNAYAWNWICGSQARPVSGK